MPENYTYKPLVGGSIYDGAADDALRWLREARREAEELGDRLRDKPEAVISISHILSRLADVQDSIHKLKVIGVQAKQERMSGGTSNGN